MMKSAVISALFFLSISGGVSSPMKDILDSMQLFMEGESEFDPQFYNRLTKCMNEDRDLLISQDKAWQGMIDCWNGTCADTDPWGETQNHYKELNVSKTSINDMEIYEPCGYASNVAYYHSVTEMCERKSYRNFSFSDDYYKAFLQSFSMQAMTSAFWHGSHTRIGHLLDNTLMGVVSYLMHQATISALDNPSNILFHLQSEPRAKNSIEIAEAFKDMFLNVNVTEWSDYTKSIDIPDYYLIYGGMISTILTVAVEDDDDVETIIYELAELFHVNEEVLSFIYDEYLPEIRNATKNLDVIPIEIVRYIGNTLGSIFKLLFAFLWQEQIIDVSRNYFSCPLMNRRGWNYFPMFNIRATQLETFQYYQSDFIHGEDIYPGDWWCNPVYPHAKWHLESAIGTLDLVYLADETYRILATYNGK